MFDKTRRASLISGQQDLQSIVEASRSITSTGDTMTLKSSIFEALSPSEISQVSQHTPEKPAAHIDKPGGEHRS
jgi:hypothetical protein